MPRTTRQPILRQDSGLQQIDAWLTAFTTFNAERLRAWPDDDLLEAERAKVTALATAMVTALRSDWLARQHR